MIALALAAALLAGAPTGEQTMQHVTGTFDVTLTPVQPSADAGPGAPGRMVLAKTFRGAIEGSGSGHGVGLCQWGAIGRARAGQGFTAILAAYYPGTQLAHRW